MKILVLSDSHGRTGIIEELVEKNAEIRHIFFLGDVLRDIETVQLLYPDKTYYKVAGNCDLFCDCVNEAVTTLGGVKIFYCHGHTLGVKYGKQYLLQRAKTEGAQIALYGHTHKSDVDMDTGILLLNPGSVAQARSGKNSYAVIDLDEKGIRPQIITL